MLDFQENLNVNKQGAHKHLKIKLFCSNEDIGCVCVKGEGVPKQQVDFLKNNEKGNGEGSCGRVAVLSLNNLSDLKNVELKLMSNGKEFKKKNLEDIRYLEKDGCIEAYIDSEGVLHPKEKDVLVRVHYKRPRGDYENWNDVHAWINGHVFDVKFNNKEDSYGRVAQLYLAKVKYLDRLGFLIRKGENRWDEKEGGERYVSLRQHEKDGAVDIYIVEGRQDIFFRRPIVINVHYRRYDDNYKNWDLWFWEKYNSKKDQPGCAVEFHKDDKYGKVATYICDDIEDVKKIGFLIRKSENGYWKEVDVELDRYISREKLLEEVSKNGEVNLYLGQNDLKVGFNKDDMDFSPKVVDATFTCPADDEGFNIDVELNTWIDVSEIDTISNKLEQEFELTCEDGTKIPIRKVLCRETNENRARLFRIYLDNAVEGARVTPIDKIYNVGFKDFKSLPVSIRKLYKHKYFRKKCTYKDDDLGVRCTKEGGEFTLWSPSADSVELCLYDKAIGGEPMKVYKLDLLNNGRWYSKIDGDLKGKFYTYRANIGGEIIESVDPYAKTLSINRERGVVVDSEYVSKEDGYKIVKPKFDGEVFPIVDDLGVKYTKESSEFRIWAPSIDDLELCLYNEDTGGTPIEKYKLNRSYGGTWHLKVDKDLKGKFYTYEASVGTQVIESIDPYAKSAGVNCERGAIMDSNDTNPEGWEDTPRPKFSDNVYPIVCEMNVRDYTINENSGVNKRYRGKFKGAAQVGTRVNIQKGSKIGKKISKLLAHGVNEDDLLCTGIDHIERMGFTHIQVMPVAKCGSVDDSRDDSPGNWGYDNVHWFVLEGSYSTNSHDPIARIKEFKEMIQAYHSKGIGVILDVVFNHTYRTQFSPFNVFSPDYFYRIKENGEYSKATECSNEIASERDMVRKFIVDAIKYWVKEFKVDGFRFDVMYLLDIETMNAIRKAVDEIDPSIKIIYDREKKNTEEIRLNDRKKEALYDVDNKSSKIWLYGEGWGSRLMSTISPDHLASKENAHKLTGIGFLDNIFANALKGDFDKTIRGFALQGLGSIWKKMLMNCLKWEVCEPNQIVNFAGSHDNLTLWDKIKKSVTDLGNVFKIFAKAMFKLAYAIVFARSGLTLVPEGDEFLRTKKCDANSYSSGDEINGIDWERKIKYFDVVQYLRGLIRVKKRYRSFNMKSKEEIKERTNFFEELPKGMEDHIVAYSINDNEKGEYGEDLVVIHNGGWQGTEVSIPKKLGEEWVTIVDDKAADSEIKGAVENNKVGIPAHSSKVLVSKKSYESIKERCKKEGKLRKKNIKQANMAKEDNSEMEFGNMMINVSRGREHGDSFKVGM